jgi:hypothetical protein
MTHRTPISDSFLDQVADTFFRHGFRTPALVALEAGKPLAFLGAQLVWVGQPLLSLFVSGNTLRQIASLLESPEELSALIERLESRRTQGTPK